MKTPGAAEAAALLRDFRFIDPDWCGAAHVPLWGGDLDVYVRSDEGDRITARQLRVLRAVLAHPDDLRPEFERALFGYYLAEVEDSYCACDVNGQLIPGGGPPKLTNPSQVWGQIDGPDLYIPENFRFRTRSAVEFELSFTCDWDPEHGLGVLYRDWKPVKFGA